MYYAHMFKRASLLRYNSSLPLPVPRDPYTHETAFLSHLHPPSPVLCIHRKHHSKISHSKTVSPWLHLSSPATGSPVPSPPPVCPAHASQTTASQNPLHPEVLLDLSPPYHDQNPSSNSVQAPVLWHGLEVLSTTGRMTATICTTHWFPWNFVE